MFAGRHFADQIIVLSIRWKQAGGDILAYRGCDPLWPLLALAPGSHFRSFPDGHPEERHSSFLRVSDDPLEDIHIPVTRLCSHSVTASTRSLEHLRCAADQADARQHIDLEQP